MKKLEEIFDKTKTRCHPDGVAAFCWTRKGQGFGTYQFYMRNGKLYCDNELDSKYTVATMLLTMVNEAKFTQLPRRKHVKN